MSNKFSHISSSVRFLDVGRKSGSGNLQQFSCLFYSFWGFGEVAIKFNLRDYGLFGLPWQFVYFKHTSRCVMLPVVSGLSSIYAGFGTAASSLKFLNTYFYRRNSILQRYFLLSVRPYCIKLMFVGMGYRPILYRNRRGVKLKLGRSHNFYVDFVPLVFGVSKKIKRVFYLIVFGFSYDCVQNVAAAVQLCRLPSPYTGRGVCVYRRVFRRKKGKSRLR